MIELGIKVTLAYLIGAVLGSLLVGCSRRRRHPQARQRQRGRHQLSAHARQAVRAARHGHRRRQGHSRRGRDSAARHSRHRHRRRALTARSCCTARRSPRSSATCFPCGSVSAVARAAPRRRVCSCYLEHRRRLLPVPRRLGPHRARRRAIVGLATVSATLAAVAFLFLHRLA